MARGSSKNKRGSRGSASFCFVSGRKQLARAARIVIDSLRGIRFYVGFFSESRARVGEAVRRRNRLAQRARPTLPTHAVMNSYRASSLAVQVLEEMLRG
jgi:hypothetical protein